MKFTVDTETKRIKAIGVNFAVSIPEINQEWWFDLEKKVRCSKFDPDTPIRNIEHKNGKILFGYWDESDCKEEDKSDAVFVEAFHFDLIEFKLESDTGAEIRPELITADLMKSYTSRNTPWLSEFYSVWKSVSGAVDASVKKTGLERLFKLKEKAKMYVRGAELLFKSGFKQSYVVKSLLTPKIDMYYQDKDRSLEEYLLLKPHEMLDMPEFLFKTIAASSSLQSAVSRYRGFKDLKEVLLLKDLVSALKKYDALGSFVSLYLPDQTVRNNLSDLVCNKSYDRSRLVEYLFKELPEKQGFPASPESISTLADYASMSAACFEKIEDKYPKALKTSHDIVMVKFNALKTAMEETECMRGYAIRRRDCGYSLDYSSEYFYREVETSWQGKRKAYYQFLEPYSTSDIVNEGKVMHHCVASYVPRMKDNPKDLICFVRISNGSSSYNHDGMDHCLTVEVLGDEIVQARGKYNRMPYATEFRFLSEVCKEKNLKLSSFLMDQYKHVVGHDFEKGCLYGREELELCAAKN